MNRRSAAPRAASKMRPPSASTSSTSSTCSTVSIPAPHVACRTPGGAPVSTEISWPCKGTTVRNDPRSAMSSEEENKALVRRFYAEMDAGTLDAMDELVAEDYVDHTPPPFPGLDSGRAGLKQAF